MYHVLLDICPEMSAHCDGPPTDQFADHPPSLPPAMSSSDGGFFGWIASLWPFWPADLPQAGGIGPV